MKEQSVSEYGLKCVTLPFDEGVMTLLVAWWKCGGLYVNIWIGEFYSNLVLGLDCVPDFIVFAVMKCVLQ